MGLASIVLVGLGAQFPNPGNYFELDFAQGPAAGSGSTRAILIMGNKTTAGSATNDTVVYGPDTAIACQTETDVITLFGTGSQLHRAFLRIAKINNTTPIYYLAVAPSAGAAATVVETIATTATSNGNHRTWCVDDFVDTPISSGDTATTIAANIVLSVNSQTRWPVTANNAAGVVTYTAKNLGPEGNWIRMQAQITPGTATIGTTTTLTANTNATGGTTADVNTTALSTILPSRYYVIVVCDSDATNVGRVVTQVNTQALPTNGLRQRVIFGSSDTLANSITLATGINAARAECIWANAVDLTPLEAAANMAAIFTFLEQGSAFGVARKNYSLFPATPNDPTLWLLKGGRNGVGGSPTPVQITSALNNGLSPLITLSNGQAQFVKRCTTRSLNGATADYRIRDAHKVSVCDYWVDDLAAVFGQQFGGKDIAPDPQPGQPLAANATSPMFIRNATAALITQYDDAGQWSFAPGYTPSAGQRPSDIIIGNLVVQQEVNPPTRVSVLALLTPIQILDQIASLAQQVS